MNQPFNARLQLHERSELDHPGHGSLYPLANLVLLRNRIPRMLLKLFQPHGNPVLLGVDLQNLHFHLLAHGEYVGRLVHPAPGKVADVQQRIHSAQVNECSIIRQAANRPAQRRAFFNLG